MWSRRCRTRACLGMALVATAALAALAGRAALAADGSAGRLAAALLGETPLLDDLRALTDGIGGRPTGSEANRASVAWGVARFREAGVEARKEAFQMPALWLERSARARIDGDARFAPRVAAMPFSTATPRDGLSAPLLDAGHGLEPDFSRLGPAARGAFVLVETAPLLDVEGLFKEYDDATAIETRAFAAGASGLVYMSSRPRNLLYRHNASRGFKNVHPMLVMEREGALRALRLLRAGRKLTLTMQIDVEQGGPYASENVIGEIRGGERADEIVLVGAHLDSWDLGQGALDNGCNVALLIDVARQMRALSLQPKRTIRFALWNGEEQGLYGSWAYTKDHEPELDRHVLAASFDIGSGRINGFFTGGRPELLEPLERALEPVRGLGEFTQVTEPIVGTDHFDFMLHGIANLVANQEPASYGPDYHAQSDSLDKVDPRQLRLNAAVVAAVTWAFANDEASWRRQTRAEVEKLVETTSLKQQMISFGSYDDWRAGKRGRR